MECKIFFKPTIAKIIIFLLLMSGLNYLIISSTFILDARMLVGLPLGFWPTGSWNLDLNPNPPEVNFSTLNFVIDIIFWYLVSCGVVALYHKIRKK